jgi:branched-chain amino acid transport system ATP-binding protein
MLLEITNLTSHYNRIQALKETTVTVGESELVALVGANGAGKTTLLRCISGVQPISGGTIAFCGHDITRASAEKRVALGIAQVPEGRQMFSPMSVEDNLRLGAYCRQDDIEPDLRRMFDMFPILHTKRHLPAGMLSGGQQQMLAIARALMSRPRLLLLDEPSMGLAPLLVEEIFSTIQLLKKEGTAIFLIEQNAYAALAVADRGYVLETGAVVMTDSGQALLTNERVKTAYLGV